MLNITFAERDAELAAQMQADLANSKTKLYDTILLVLHSEASAQDSTVQQAIQTAQSRNHIIAVAQLDDTPLPDSVSDAPVLDVRDGYQANALRRFLRRADVGEGVVRSNNRVLLYMVIIVVIVFVVTIWGLTTERIGFPTDEFATENALREGQIQTLIFPTIDPLIPRSTQEAEFFPRTVEAASTRNAPILVLTATGRSVDIRNTQDAIATSAQLTSTARAQATSEANQASD